MILAPGGISSERPEIFPWAFDDLGEANSTNFPSVAKVTVPVAVFIKSLTSPLLTL